MAINRRSFLERLGLGVGATMLGPIADRLVSEARGATPTRKRVMFVLIPNGMNPVLSFTPNEFKDKYARISDARNYTEWTPVMNAPKTFTWPEAFKTLEPYRDRSLLIDGLGLDYGEPANPSGTHGAGFFALSCSKAPPNTTKLDTVQHNPPTGPTIDQFIAERIGQSSVHKSCSTASSRARTTPLRWTRCSPPA